MGHPTGEVYESVISRLCAFTFKTLTRLLHSMCICYTLISKETRHTDLKNEYFSC